MKVLLMVPCILFCSLVPVDSLKCYYCEPTETDGTQNKDCLDKFNPDHEFPICYKPTRFSFDKEQKAILGKSNVTDIKTEKLVAVCVKVKAPGPDGKDYVGRGCTEVPETIAEDCYDEIVNEHDGLEGKICYCFSEKCNKAISFGPYLSLGLAPFLVMLKA